VLSLDEHLKMRYNGLNLRMTMMRHSNLLYLEESRWVVEIDRNKDESNSEFLGNAKRIQGVNLIEWIGDYQLGWQRGLTSRPF